MSDIEPIGKYLPEALSSIGTEPDEHAAARLKVIHAAGERAMLHESGINVAIPDAEGQIGDDLPE